MPETSARCEKRKTMRIGEVVPVADEGEERHQRDHRRACGGATCQRGGRLDRLAIAADGDRGQYIFMALGPTV
jgi:hypothetical protein